MNGGYDWLISFQHPVSHVSCQRATRVTNLVAYFNTAHEAEMQLADCIEPVEPLNDQRWKDN